MKYRVSTIALVALGFALMLVSASATRSFAGTAPATGPPPVGIQPAAAAIRPHGQYGAGYWLAQRSGAVVPYGDAPDLQGLARHSTPVVGIAATPGGRGYLLADAAGGVVTVGRARYHGSMRGRSLNAAVVGIAYTPSGKGYYLVASDGGVFTFGDAHFHGSMGGRPLNAPMVGIAVTPAGNGYFLLAADGGVFTFGDARFHGSAAALRVSAPISSMATTTNGKGYWLAGRDGSVYSFGSAPFYGSTPVAAADNAVTIARSPSGRGYLVAFQNGSVVDFGDAASCSQFLDLPSVIEHPLTPQSPAPGSLVLPSGETPDTVGLALPFDPTAVRSMLMSTCHGPSPVFRASSPWHIDFQRSAVPIFDPRCDVSLLAAKLDARGHFVPLDGLQVGKSGRLQVRSTQMSGQRRFRISVIGSCYAVAKRGAGDTRALPFRFNGGGDSLPFSSATPVTVRTTNGLSCAVQVLDNKTGAVVGDNQQLYAHVSVPAGSYYVRSEVGCAVTVRSASHA